MKKARFNLKGKDRTNLINAISDIAGKMPERKASRCIVGDFTINSAGTVCCEDPDELERLVHNLIGDGFRPVKKEMTFADILNNEEARPIIERIEEAEAEIRDRGIDPDDESEFWVRACKKDIEELKNRFGYIWK